MYYDELCGIAYSCLCWNSANMHQGIHTLGAID